MDVHHQNTVVAVKESRVIKTLYLILRLWIQIPRAQSLQQFKEMRGQTKTTFSNS